MFKIKKQISFLLVISLILSMLWTFTANKALAATHNVTSELDLENALQAAAPGDDIVFANNITITDTYIFKNHLTNSGIIINGNGHSLIIDTANTTYGLQIEDSFTLKNMTLDFSQYTVAPRYAIKIENAGASGLVLDNITISNIAAGSSTVGTRIIDINGLNPVTLNNLLIDSSCTVTGSYGAIQVSASDNIDFTNIDIQAAAATGFGIAIYDSTAPAPANGTIQINGLNIANTIQNGFLIEGNAVSDGIIFDINSTNQINSLASGILIGSNAMASKLQGKVDILSPAPIIVTDASNTFYDSPILGHSYKIENTTAWLPTTPALPGAIFGANLNDVLNSTIFAGVVGVNPTTAAVKDLNTQKYLVPVSTVAMLQNTSLAGKDVQLLVSSATASASTTIPVGANIGSLQGAIYNNSGNGSIVLSPQIEIAGINYTGTPKLPIENFDFNTGYNAFVTANPNLSVPLTAIGNTSKTNHFSDTIIITLNPGIGNLSNKSIGLTSGTSLSSLGLTLPIPTAPSSSTQFRNWLLNGSPFSLSQILTGNITLTADWNTTSSGGSGGSSGSSGGYNGGTSNNYNNSNNTATNNTPTNTNTSTANKGFNTVTNSSNNSAISIPIGIYPVAVNTSSQQQQQQQQQQNRFSLRLNDQTANYIVKEGSKVIKITPKTSDLSNIEKHELTIYTLPNNSKSIRYDIDEIQIDIDSKYTKNKDIIVSLKEITSGDSYQKYQKISSDKQLISPKQITFTNGSLGNIYFKLDQKYPLKNLNVSKYISSKSQYLNLKKEFVKLVKMNNNYYVKLENVSSGTYIISIK